MREGLFERVERLDVGLAFVDIDLEAELAQDGGQHARSITDYVGTRLDVWLDVSCLYKTRSEAQRACQGGKIEVNGQGTAKPHREVRPGDRVTISRPGARRQQVVVRALADQHLPKARRGNSTRTSRRRPRPRSRRSPTSFAPAGSRWRPACPTSGSAANAVASAVSTMTPEPGADRARMRTCGPWLSNGTER